MEEDIDKNNQFKSKIIRSLIEIQDAVCNFYVDSDLNDSNINGNNALLDFNEKNLENVRFGEVNW